VSLAYENRHSWHQRQQAGNQEGRHNQGKAGSYMEVTPRFGFKDDTVCLCATGGLTASVAGKHGQ
jgi:hypothetical protein